jgi:hypothetical protein
MVAPIQRFPLVRWAVLVCSFDDFGTQSHSLYHTKEIVVQPGGILRRHPNVLGWPSVCSSDGGKGVDLGERDADALVAAPDPTAAADELIGLDFKRE